MSTQANKNEGPRLAPFSVSVVVHLDGDAWVAQCLEYDVAAQGPSREVVMQRFMRTLSNQILLDQADGKLPLADLPQAPQWYFDKAVETTQGLELPVYVRAAESQKRPSVNARARFLDLKGNSNSRDSQTHA